VRFRCAHLQTRARLCHGGYKGCVLTSAKTHVFDPQNAFLSGWPKLQTRFSKMCSRKQLRTCFRNLILLIQKRTGMSKTPKVSTSTTGNRDVNHEDGNKSKRTVKKSSKFLDSEAMRHENKKKAKSGVKSKKSAGLLYNYMCNCSLHIINKVFVRTRQHELTLQ
jgi:hypothetical protein